MQANRHTDRPAGRRAVIKYPWFIDSEVSQIATFLATKQNPESLIIFALLLSTGQKFSRLKSIKWDNYNGRLGIIRLGDRSIKIPDSVAAGFELLRETAVSENQPIISKLYRVFWRELETACDRLGIENSGVLSIRNTFARKHFETFQSKQKLQSALGLTTLRSLPTSIFLPKPESLFDGVL